MYRILIVEDDPGIAQALKEHLNMWEFEVRIVTNFRHVLEDFTQFEPHLVLLDILLPAFNGYHWCREIRRVSKAPILFLSSASDNMNIVMAMNMGGDDFIAKPFDPDVLIAKIQAILRRAYDFTDPTPVLSHRGAFLLTADHTLLFGEEKIALTKNEYRILLTLMENKGKVVSRERLIERLWQTESFIDDNTLTVNVNRLRRKLDAAGLSSFITTRFGEGYIITEEE